MQACGSSIRGDVGGLLVGAAAPRPIVPKGFIISSGLVYRDSRQPGPGHDPYWEPAARFAQDPCAADLKIDTKVKDAVDTP